MWENVRQRNHLRDEAKLLLSGITGDDIEPNIDAEERILYFYHVCRDLVGADESDLLKIFGREGIDYINSLGKGKVVDADKFRMTDNEIVCKMRKKLK